MKLSETGRFSRRFVLFSYRRYLFFLLDLLDLSNGPKLVELGQSESDLPKIAKMHNAIVFIALRKIRLVEKFDE